MLKGFKEFILRGNVVELATAVIIGGAFTAIVTAFTSSIIEPLFAAIPTGDCDGAAAPAAEAAEGTVAGPIQSCPLGFKIISDNEATFMDFGALLTAIINFLIIAAVVYFLIIMPYTKLSQLRKKPEEEETQDEVSLLTEIRDLLDPDGKIAAKKEAEEAAKKEAEEKEAAAKAAAERELTASRLGGEPPIPPGATQRFTAPPPAPQGPPPGGAPQGPPPGAAPQGPPPGGPGYDAPGGPPSQPLYPNPNPQHFGAPYEQQPPAGGYPTPPPAQGNYPAPGSYPGQFPPEGEYPQDPDGPGRHSR
ncbi:large conductance mechanosensitive channel protein MscL [Gordonia amarae]|uniref:Large-conductance mechanosensitive channel n=2 Tax=Gordonia amarae TaxID=36821 RepID=G7GPB5_9ACTN|nr:MscL family protein [Gordonia amarae]MCS3877974.1 large conductance mechanosensitive channel [Gordonia amarae]QHN16678.1 large conductance mechanosensitive channel protein MscL [Gordonia amarae]QHN21203.1 large conductance mechanosensitive channel protein MscL [Gordonia amarae]QHN30057.1 large conductance mechanosensitive channel protein MscL [Gordonia amarae]QHN38830.1 large conductance mechanosensitive channel protein MscL [Gordonia amarae]